ncbi:hypothetical protein M9H77_04725 [Catharanthus roseus]|uniref:Uncharacterized protein n=1 Tax=Catharanthus roseus TaxID=4058 RepID=A0ACC0CEV5_CATRO|nr:hypothetical protein M9H77_04725 [Catharanthus roseus]
MGGRIPEEIGNLSSLIDFGLADNELTGQIPTTILGLQNILQFSFNNNQLTGYIPSNFCKLNYLGLLELDGNLLSEIGNLKALRMLDLSVSNFSGHIPSTIGNLQGSIPEPLGSLSALETLDLSQNNLSGSIPESLETLQYLTNFNVSLNHLSDQIPSHGPFKNFTIQSFLCNEALYQSQMQNKGQNQTEQFDVIQTVRYSCYELRQATEGYNEANLIGKGSVGSLYKGILKNGTLIAIKVFNLQECEVLRNLRHRNLTKIISSCSNNDLKALVLEYMPNGSLEKWLYSEEHSLDMMQRLNTMIDVASALEYLHHGYSGRCSV